jgi:hypothetical protein
MGASRIAGKAAVVGGLLWLVEVASVWAGAAGDGLLTGALTLFGGLALAVALLAGGYSVVSTAPVWLRVLVSAAVLVLGWVLFLTIDSTAKGIYSSDGWLHDEIGILVVAGLAVIVGAVVFRASPAPAPREAVTRGRRAAR